MADRFYTTTTKGFTAIVDRLTESEIFHTESSREADTRVRALNANFPPLVIEAYDELNYGPEQDRNGKREMAWTLTEVTITRDWTGEKTKTVLVRRSSEHGYAGQVLRSYAEGVAA